MARSPRPAGSELDDDGWIKSDAELGIGEQTEAELEAEKRSRIEAAMGDPVIAAAIEQHIQARVAEMAAGGTAPASAPSNTDFLAGMRLLAKEIADSINRSTAATVEQMPGHVKPIPVEEIEARAAAFIEMSTLIRDMQRKYLSCTDTGDMVEAERMTPMYLLLEDFFGDGETGSEMYVAGTTIRWFGPPGTYMDPRNAAARKISEAMWRYIGGQPAPTAEEIGSYVSQMNRPRMPGADIPELPELVGRTPRGRLGASKVDTIAPVEVGPDRIMGTVVQEVKGGFGRGPRQVRGPDLVNTDALAL